MNKQWIEARRVALEKDFDAAIKAVAEKGDGSGIVGVLKAEFLALLEGLGKQAEDDEKAFSGLQTAIEALANDKKAIDDRLVEYQKEADALRAKMEKDGNRGQKGLDLRAFLAENKPMFDRMRAGEKEPRVKIEAAMLTGTSFTGATEADKLLFPVPAYDPVIGQPAQPQRTVLQDVNVGTMDSPRIAYVDRISQTGHAQFIAEGVLKPSAQWTWKIAHAEVAKIAVTVKVSNEMLEDYDFMETEIRNLAGEDVIREINKELVVHQSYNSPAADGLARLTEIGTAYIAGGRLAGKVVTPNTADALFAAATQIRCLGYGEPLTAYINCVEIALMKMEKTSQGAYLDTTRMLENITLRPNPDLAAGQFVIGVFNLFKVRFKKQLTIDMGPYGVFEDTEGNIVSDWEANMVTLRAEARLASYIHENDKNAFVVDNIDVVKADIAKP